MKAIENIYDSEWKKPPHPIVVRAGDPNGYYEDHGFLLGIDTDPNTLTREFVIHTFSHCSCYGTIEGAGESWRGDEQGLRKIIENDLDVAALPMERKAGPSDYDYGIWTEFRSSVTDFMEWTND